MKKHNKFLVCAITAVLGAIAAVPAAAQAEEYAPESSAADSVQISSWYTDEEGRIFYYDKNGEAVTGTQVINGRIYLFSENGVQKTGWRTVEGQRLYYDPITGKHVYGWFEYCGKNYYIEPGLGKATGYVFDADGNSYLFDDYGAQFDEEGFVSYKNACYYIGADGKLLTAPAEIDGIYYDISINGEISTGWQTYNGKSYYFDTATGQAKTGLFEESGSWYYVTAESGKNTGIVNIDGVNYLFDDNGVMQTGLQSIESKLYYFNNNGSYQTGWLTLDNGTYYFGEDGAALLSWQEIDSKKYYFGQDGIMLTGRQIIEGNKYSFDENGAMQTGLVAFDDGTYCFGEDGIMLTGWQTINDEKYYFDNNGKMLTGRQIIEGNKYYIAENGVMQTGWVTLDDGTYYFGQDGIMLTGRQIIEGNKYYLNEKGIMQTGWITLDDGKYYFGADGIMLTGWQDIDGNKYHFSTRNGKLDTFTVLDGYVIGADGIAKAPSAVQKRAQNVIASIGKSADAIYNYVTSKNKYKLIESTKTLAQIESIGWSHFANYALDNKFVVCYYFAAVTDVLFQNAGYESRIVYGTGRGTGDHYWNQIKVNGVWTNYDTCNGYKNVTFEFLQAQNYTFKQYVYPDYNK
ncbi:MAG: hypothetical protein J6L05_03490 [Ruminococcus sp.]|nr:hypothetical protein [Ruminococcus sp.]